MSFQMSVSARNGRLSALPNALGASPKVQIWSGSEPANGAAASTGTKLAEWTLAASGYFTTPSAGAMSLSSLPLGTTGLAGGTAGYYRFVDSGGSCHIQGNCTATGGGGDMTLDNTSIALSQAVNITGYTLTEGGA